MGVTITCSERQSINVGRTFYVRISDIDEVQRCFRLEVERRDYPKQRQERGWSSKYFRGTVYEGHFIREEDSPVLEGLEIIFVKLDDYSRDAKRVRLDIRAKDMLPVSMFFWNDFRDPWRPAFDKDGIYEEDIMGRVIERSVQVLRDGTPQAYALAINPHLRKQIAYLLIDEHPIRGIENDYKIIARIEDGEVSDPRKRGNVINHDGPLDYLEGIETAGDSIAALAKRPDVTKGFWGIPSSYDMHKPMSQTLRGILDR